MLKKDNSLIEYTLLYNNTDLLLSCNYIEYTVAPANVVGCKGGAATVVQYVESIKHRLNESYSLTTDDLYLQTRSLSSSNDNECFTLKQYVDKAISNENWQPCYLSSIQDLKVALHRYGPILVETAYTMNITNSKCMNGAFIISSSQDDSIFDNSISKSFIAVGYDNEGIVVQNNHGINYGSLGFVKIQWQYFLSTIDSQPFFVKGVFFKDSIDNIGQI